MVRADVQAQRLGEAVHTSGERQETAQRVRRLVRLRGKKPSVTTELLAGAFSNLLKPVQLFENQTNAARSDSLRSAILPSTSTTPSSETSGDNKWQSKYPFREKVKHLPLAERKEQYELEIRRLFESPHPSHITRLKPEKVIAEKADISHTCNSFVTWNPMQLTYDIGKGALSQRAFKRCNRSRPDPWRRYGALRKLHEIGGIGCTPPNQVGVRVQQTFYVIEPGSTPPAPPLSAPITTVEEYGTTDILLNPKKRKKPEPYIEKME
ncbi:hypothetical protein Q1695_006462 [Nippostrongylus brasiliensis]|nr:hypothetical protein Q1695_006462 [Nippostrongylus brasiliensis]